MLPALQPLVSLSFSSNQWAYNLTIGATTVTTTTGKYQRTVGSNSLSTSICRCCTDKFEDVIGGFHEVLSALYALAFCEHRIFLSFCLNCLPQSNEDLFDTLANLFWILKPRMRSSCYRRRWKTEKWYWYINVFCEIFDTDKTLD